MTALFAGSTLIGWNFSDLMNGMMIIPNTIGLLMLSKVVKEETCRYFKWKP